jgi:hypothetical protein
MSTLWKPVVVPLDLRGVLQQTLGILSQAFPPQENTEIYPDQTVALPNISDDKFGSQLYLASTAS